MKLDAFKRFDFSRRFKSVSKDIVPCSVVDSEKEISPQDSLLSIVYALDERTKFPNGDLSYLVSDKANPQVKQFILDNLMLDVSSAKVNTSVSGLSDDDILLLTRQPDEDIDNYMERLNSSMMRDRFLVEQASKASEPKNEPLKNVE